MLELPDSQLPESPSPQDFGLPANPTSTELVRWERQTLFLESFAVTGSVGESCLATGIPADTVSSWDSRDTHGFKKRVTQAKIIALGYIDREIRRRGVEGVDHPVIHQGIITDTYKQYSDNLLMFRAKRLDPEYRDNPRVQQANAVPAHTVINIIVPEGAKAKGQVVEGESRPVEDGTLLAPE